MEQTQQSPKIPFTEPMAQEPMVEQPERRRRLRIDLLEERVAPSAIWGDWLEEDSLQPSRAGRPHQG